MGFAAWQLRAARAAADISIQTLSELSAVSVSSIRRAERAGSAPMSRVNCKALTDALAALDVVMSAPDIEPAAVTMTNPGPADDGTAQNDKGSSARSA
ncbi:helix-turn-helix domain-containing protein [Brevundimonas sp. DC300-4]|uniref:helix-turn-helix domain-containing protein n=1 Tax=Brevundimonas sp. DC300-4 TaxID=2804594 RepID=UPI003CF7003F